MSESITDHLHQITPMHGGRGDRYELVYDSVVWDAVSESERVGADALVTHGRHGHFEADSSDFTALETYLDVPTNHNVMFVTDEAVHVLKHEVRGIGDDQSGIAEKTFEDASGTALSYLSKDGKIAGLRPVEPRAPDRAALSEAPHFNEDIESTFVREERRDGRSELVVYVIPSTKDLDEREALENLRSQHGVTYSKPDQVVFVDDKADVPDP